MNSHKRKLIDDTKKKSKHSKLDIDSDAIAIDIIDSDAIAIDTIDSDAIAINICKSLYAENSDVYKQITHDTLVRLIMIQENKMDIVNNLQEKQKRKRKWNTLIYADIIQCITPMMNYKDIIKLFHFNKYWNNIMRTNPSIWNKQYIYNSTNDMIDISNSTLFLLSSINITLSIHDTFNKLTTLFNYITHFNCLKTVTILLSNNPYLHIGSFEFSIHPHGSFIASTPYSVINNGLF